VDEQLTDDQQAAIVRNWLRENGLFIVLGIAGALGGLFGWQQWQAYDVGQSVQASEIYEEVVVSLREGRTAQGEILFGALSEQYPGSPYVDQARFVLARSLMDRSDFEAAAVHLAAVVASTGSPEFRHVATLRLARVRLQQQQFEAALAVLDADNDTASAFAPRYEEVRGDVYYAQNQMADARVAYQAALSSPQQPPVIDRVYVQAKLDALGGAAESAVDELPSGLAADDATVMPESGG
jgi:predicted negative regulator of RcsB-dependent stress response